MLSTLTQVAIGGALGASARYLTGVGILRVAGAGFPYATMLVNVVGSLAMGVLIVILSQSGNRFSPFLMTGVLGGFTTFSAFSLDAMTLIERGETGAAALYVGGSVALCLVAVFAGATLARAMA